MVNKRLVFQTQQAKAYVCVLLNMIFGPATQHHATCCLDGMPCLWGMSIRKVDGCKRSILANTSKSWFISKLLQREPNWKKFTMTTPSRSLIHSLVRRQLQNNWKWYDLQIPPTNHELEEMKKERRIE